MNGPEKITVKINVDFLDCNVCLLEEGEEEGEEEDENNIKNNSIRMK